MEFRKILKNLFVRNCSSLNSLDLEYSISSDLVNIEDFRTLKEAKDQAFDLMVERYTIENMDPKLKKTALAVWWRRFYMFVDKYPQFFPEPHEKHSNLVHLDVSQR